MRNAYRTILSCIDRPPYTVLHSILSYVILRSISNNDQCNSWLYGIIPCYCWIRVHSTQSFLYTQSPINCAFETFDTNFPFFFNAHWTHLSAYFVYHSNTQTIFISQRYLLPIGLLNFPLLLQQKNRNFRNDHLSQIFATSAIDKKKSLSEKVSSFSSDANGVKLPPRAASRVSKKTHFQANAALT